MKSERRLGNHSQTSNSDIHESTIITMHVPPLLAILSTFVLLRSSPEVNGHSEIHVMRGEGCEGERKERMG